MPRGAGNRHSKNAGTMGSENMTYAERKHLGHGTIKERLGKETVKDFDSCALGLQHAKDPMVTPEGVLYDKENIYNCLLYQKKDIARKLKVWEEQEAKKRDKEADQQYTEQEKQIQQFHQTNHGAGKWTEIHEEDIAQEAGAKSVATTQFDQERIAAMKAFWLPSKTPTAEITVKKPDTDTKCPTTSKKLRLKDLVPVKWTPVPTGEGGRYMCPILYKTFTNTTQILVLKATGDAISEDAYNRCIKKEGVYNGKKIKAKDVIKLQKGGCGFTASGTQVESKFLFQFGIGSGMQDGRGQTRGAPSKFALAYAS